MSEERADYWRAVHDEAVRAGQYDVVDLIHEVWDCHDELQPPEEPAP